MRADRSACLALANLASLHSLRVAQGEIGLADAKAAREEALMAEADADSRRDSALGEYREILSSGLFRPERFRLAGAILNALELDAGAARERTAQAREVEAKRELRWQRHRHERDRLGSLHKAARRKLGRKEEEKALAEATQSLLARSGKAQA